MHTYDPSGWKVEGSEVQGHPAFIHQHLCSKLFLSHLGRPARCRHDYIPSAGTSAHWAHCSDRVFLGTWAPPQPSRVITSSHDRHFNKTMTASPHQFSMAEASCQSYHTNSGKRMAVVALHHATVTRQVVRHELATVSKSSQVSLWVTTVHRQTKMLFILLTRE